MATIIEQIIAIDQDAQKRLDEAIRILQLMRILPFLKGNLFS